MKNYYLLAALGGVGLLVTGCPPKVEYINVNGMTIAKRCIPYVIYQDTSVKITAGGGAPGYTISLGAEITPQVLQRATGALQIIDQARMQCCEGARQAAYGNERARYERMRDLEEQNTTKLIQFAQIVVGQPTANVPPVESAPKPGESAAPSKKPTPKPAIAIGKEKLGKINKWLGAYEPVERVVVTGSFQPTPIGAPDSEAPETDAEARQAMVTNVLKTPAKPNSYFGLRKK